MYTKIAIFGVISALLGAAISSSPVAFGLVACWDMGENTKWCTTTQGPVKECIKGDDGKWKCKPLVESSVPPDLQDALEIAPGDNEATSEQVVPSKDRFCKQGTGGDTGKPCIPCDPGLPLPGCVDIVTGGPLDMPETATSESGKNDTKVPKDLGGLNDDDDGAPSINPGLD